MQKRSATELRRTPGCQKTFWEFRRAAALRAVFRIQRHVRWIRKPCAARFPCTFSRPRRMRRREASSLWAVAQSAKRPAGVSKYKGCARPARRTPIFARERNERWARSAPSAKIERPGKAGRYEFTLEGTEGSVSPVGCCHRRWQSDPKESTETSGGRGQRPPRRLRLRNYGPPNLPERVYQQSDSEAAAGHVACRR